ncbi:MAG: hypothetical protein Q9223_005889 [Gallowayella weberi]
MIHRMTMAALVVLLFTSPFTAALPQVSDATSANPTVFWPWSSDPACVSSPTACKANCTDAVKSLCAKDLKEENLTETVGECTVHYMREIGNTIPTYDQCYSAFAYINDAGKPGPDGCGGTFGGALGWDKNDNRTIDPIFAIYPTNGNGNCFKRLGDTSPPLAQDTLPNGAKIPIGSCPSATGRRRRDALQTFEKKHDIQSRDDNMIKCFVEDTLWTAGCNVGCVDMAVITGSFFGLLASPLWLTCFGACTKSGWDVFKRCYHEEPGKLKPRAKPATKPHDPCSNINQWAFQCPAVRMGMLALHNCPGSSAAEAAPNARGSGGEVNF